MADIRSDLILETSAAQTAVDDLVAAIDAQLGTLGESLAASLSGASDAIAASLADSLNGALGGLSLDLGSVGTALTDSLDSGAQAAAVSVADALTQGVDASGQALTDALITGGGAGATAVADQLQTEVATALEGGVTAGIGPAADAMQTEVFNALHTGVQEGLTDALSTADLSAIETPLADAVAAAVGNGIDTASTDTSGLDALGTAGQAAGNKAAEGLGNAAGAARGVDLAVAGATGSLASLGGGAKELLPAGAAIVAIGAGVGELVGAAEKAQSAQIQLNAVFGDTADRVKQINIGGLAGNVEDLGIKVGATSTQINTGLTFLGRLGQGAGASATEIQKTTKEVSALTLQAIAINPALGTFDQASRKLTTGLITGRTQALAPFGLAVNRAQVQVLGAQIALESGRTAVSKFDLASAGAALAVQALGNKLGTNFATGLTEAKTKFAALRAQIEEGLVKAGTPLLGPLLDTATKLAPLAVALGTAVGGLFRVVLPLADLLATGLSDAIKGTVSGFEQIGSALSPAISAFEFVGAPIAVVFGALGALNDLLGGVPGRLTELAVVFGLLGAVLTSTIIPAVAKAGTALIEFIDTGVTRLASTLPSAGVAAEVMGAEVAAGSAEAVVGLEAVGPAAETAAADVDAAMATAEASNPLGWIIAGVGLVVSAFGFLHHSSTAAAVDISKVTDNVATASAAFVGGGAAADKLGQSMSAALQKSQDFKPFAEDLAASGNKLAGQLAKVGLSAHGLAVDLNSGQQGAIDYARAIETIDGSTDAVNARLRQLGLTTSQVATTMGQGGKAANDLVLKIAGGKEAFLTSDSAAAQYARTLEKQVGDFKAAQQAQQDYYKGQINALAGTVKLTDAQQKQLDSGKNLGQLYADLSREAETQAEKQAAAAQATFQATGGWNELAAAVVKAGGSYANLPDIAGSNKVDPKQIKAFAKSVSDALNGIVTDAQSTLPKSSDAIKAWSDGIQSAFQNLSQASSASKKDSKEIAADQSALAFATDPQRIIDNINKQRIAIEQFSTNVAALFRSGNIRAAQEALKLGPEVGGAYAASLVNAGPQVEAGVNNALLGGDKANADFLNRVKTQWGPEIVGEFGTVAQNADGTFSFSIGTGSQSKKALDANLSATAALFGVKSPQFKSAAADLGLTTTQALKSGLTGLPVTVDGQVNAALHIVQAKHGEFGRAGGDLGQGVADGISGKSGAVGAAGSGVGKTGAAKVSEGARAQLTIEGNVIGNAIVNALHQAGIGAGTHAKTDGAGIGSSLIDGIITGVNAKAQAALNVVHNIAVQLGFTAKAGVQSGSPSKVFIEIGKSTMEGLAIGIGSNASLPIAKIESLTHQLVNQAVSSVESLETQFATQSARHVLGVASSEIGHQVGLLTKAADAQINAAALASVNALGRSLTSGGPAALFDIATGRTSLADLIAPVGSEIDAAISKATQTINKDLTNAGKAVHDTLSGLTSEEIKRLNEFRSTNGVTTPDKITALTFGAQLPAVKLAPTAGLPPSAVPVTFETTVHVQIPSDFRGTPQQAAEITRLTTDAAAQALQVRLAQIDLASRINAGSRTGA